MADLASLYLVRRPVYDRRMGVIAYEILHRETNHEAQGMDAVQTILRADPANIVGEKKLIVHVGPKAIGSSFVEALPIDKTILAVSQDQFQTASDFDALDHAAGLGYKICIENLDITSSITERFKIAKYLKIDTLEDIPFVLARVEMDLVASVLPGDQIEVRIWVSRIGNTSWDFQYSIWNENRKLEHVRAKTVQVYYDYRNGLKKSIPEEFRIYLTNELASF